MHERLEARGAAPSKTKDLVARAGGIGMLLFARSQPDTPGKLTAHAFSYEHMEIAAYDLLALIADRAGDRETAHVARSIREQKSDMAVRLAAGFDRAVEASPSGELPDYLADAHAIEGQAIELLEKGQGVAGQSDLAGVSQTAATSCSSESPSGRETGRPRAWWSGSSGKSGPRPRRSGGSSTRPWRRR